MVKDQDGDKDVLTVVSNPQYGVLVNDDYFDFDLTKARYMFLTISEGRVYLSIDGLSYADMFYSKELPDEFKGKDKSFSFILDDEYQKDLDIVIQFSNTGLPVTSSLKQ